MPVPAASPVNPGSAREVLLADSYGPGPERTAGADVVRMQVATAVRDLAQQLGANAAGQTWLQRWRTLAALGRTDLVVGRLVEGHLDALAILAEAGRAPVPDALYGVWASASGGTGLRLNPAADGLRLDGGMRFCSGTDTVDRALVTATDSEKQLRLLDISVDRTRMVADRDSWPAVGMDASDSFDIAVDALPVSVDDLVGPPGFYGERAGLPLGGIGVAAVWLGGAQGLLDATLGLLTRFGADDHQLAHVGAVTAAIESAAATLVATASLLDGGLAGARSAAAVTGSAAADVAVLHRVALTCRSVVEAAVATAVQRLPRIAGPVALSRDGAYAHRLADLEVYVRQHHAERDLARLGAAELADPWSTASGSTTEAER